MTRGPLWTGRGHGWEWEANGGLCAAPNFCWEPIPEAKASCFLIALFILSEISGIEEVARIVTFPFELVFCTKHMRVYTRAHHSGTGPCQACIPPGLGSRTWSQPASVGAGWSQEPHTPSARVLVGQVRAWQTCSKQQ